jgi:hypothetical protein
MITQIDPNQITITVVIIPDRVEALDLLKAKDQRGKNQKGNSLKVASLNQGQIKNPICPLELKEEDLIETIKTVLEIRMRAHNKKIILPKIREI